MGELVREGGRLKERERGRDREREGGVPKLYTYNEYELTVLYFPADSFQRTFVVRIIIYNMI